MSNEADNNVDLPQAEKTLNLSSAWIWKEASKVPDGLQEWWDKRDIGETLQDKLSAIVEVLAAILLIKTINGEMHCMQYNAYLSGSDCSS